jgi:hypothetical protein
MSHETHHPESGGGRLDGIDPRLNVFALANGMDLSKGPGFRRLEWFTEGKERGILIESDGDGSFKAKAITWSTGSDEIRDSAEIGDRLSAEELVKCLGQAIETANAL